MRFRRTTSSFDVLVSCIGYCEKACQSACKKDCETACRLPFKFLNSQRIQALWFGGLTKIVAVEARSPAPPPLSNPT